VVGQLLQYDLPIPAEHIHELLQNFEMESWSDQLPVGSPLVTCKRNGSVVTVLTATRLS
jgi:hypothetical protein